MKNLRFLVQSALCSVAMFIAMNSIGSMCVGRYYQPEEPKELSKLKNKKLHCAFKLRQLRQYSDIT